MTEINAQEWLNNNHQENKITTEKIHFSLWKAKTKQKETELEGEVAIRDYPGLREIDLSQAKGITKLTIENCPNITEIILYDNLITEIVGLENLAKLRKLNFGKTEIEEIDISKNVELEEVSFHKNNNRKIQIKGFGDFVRKNRLLLWNSINTMAFPWEQIFEKDLKEIAEELGIGEKVADKSFEQIKDIIKQEAGRLRANEDKIKEKLPDLIDKQSGQIDDDELDNLQQLDDNEEKTIEKMRKLEIKSEWLEDYIRIELGDEALEKVLAEIGQAEQIAQIEVVNKK